MIFELKWTKEALTQYSALKGNASKVDELKKVQRALGYLQTNIRHSSLNTHKYESLPHPWKSGESVFEAYAENRTPEAYRIFWCYGPQKRQITILSIVSHP